MRKTVIAVMGAVLFSLIAPSVNFGQTTNPNMPNWHSKYWFYRWRLRNDFMVMGSGDGQSLVAESRNTERKEIIKWADAMIQHGYYLTMLAIEHKILETKGRYADLKNNERELYFAIKAFERVDYNTETFYSSEGNDQDAYRVNDTPLRPDVNGFFFRDDVPPDFVNTTPYPAGSNPTYTANYDHLTSKRTGIEYGDFYYSKSDFEGIWANDGYLAPPDLTRPKMPIVDFTKKVNDVKVFGLGEESQDQVIRLLLGFETIVKSIENVTYGIDTDKDGVDDATMNFQEEAKRHSTNIIGRMAGHFSGTKTIDVDNNFFWAYPTLGIPTSPYWTIYNPRNNKVSLGGAVFGYMPPIQIVSGSLFTSNNDLGIGSSNYALGAYSPIFTSTWNLGIGGYGNNANAKMALILNVISNSGGAITSNGVARHLYEKSKEKHFQGLYTPLYDYYWNWDPNSSADQGRKEEAYNYANLLLEMAPCVGPHNFGYTNINVASTGSPLGVFSPNQDPDGIPIYWNVPFLFDNSHDTWDDGIRQDKDGNDAVDEGWFAGVDYMLLYNLIYANNDGEKPLYHDLINRLVDYDIDTDLSSSMVGYSAEGLLIGAFENMKITGNIYGNTHVSVKALDYVEIDNGITDPSNSGSITYETGKITCGTEFTSQNTPYSIDQCATCGLEQQMGSFVAPKTSGRIKSNYLEMKTIEQLIDEQETTRGSGFTSAENDGISVFPNPVNDLFEVSGYETLQELVLLDKNGSEVRYFDISDKLHDISDLSAGVYMLVIKFNENETTHIKLVKL